MTALYDSRDTACKQPFGALKTGQPATFTLRLSKTTQAQTPMLRLYFMDLWDAPMDIPMEVAGCDLVYNTYTCSFSTQTPALYAYRFVFVSADHQIQVSRGQDGLAVIGSGDLWQLTVYDSGMQTPSCLREGVLYQIFPDRFYSSGTPKQNVPSDRKLRKDWGAIPDWRPNTQGEVTNSDYFCGDLAGIAQKLGYLQSLGVTAIYLNPVFEAHSNHRYNTADYFKIDPLLGTNQDFANLCAKAKSMGIAVILDGVFSHTGSDSVYFNREGRYGTDGAYNNPESPYFPWYRFTNYPTEYESWWGFRTLPNVEENEPSYKAFICGPKGVLSYWMELGAGGFRLDVADELPDGFLEQLRRRVKAENPDAAIIGEVWEDASNKVSYGVRRKYLLGKQLDSVTNYPFKDAILSYIRYGDGSSFYNRIMVILENYPQPVLAGLMNCLSSHDTPRAITMLAGEPMGDNGREWQEAYHDLSPSQYRLGCKLLVLATILQFGLPGIPCIYYGDEAGLYGYKDPFNRVCYPWDQEDLQLLDSFRKLGQIRSEYPVFSQADFIPLVFGNGVCAFTRAAGNRTFLFAVNRQDKAFPLNLPYQNSPEVLMVGGEYSGGFLAPYSGVVLLWEH